MTTATQSRTQSTPNGPKRRSQGARVCRFVEQYTCFTNGEWIGRPFRLQPWQRRLIYELFEVGDDDLRRYRWALVGVPKKNGKCSTIDTMYSMADGSLKSAGELHPGDVVISWDEGAKRLVPARVSAVADNGVRPIIEVVTKRGRHLRVTEEHPVLTTTGWVQASQLKAGQRVAAANAWEPVGCVPLDFDTALFLGHMVGDGNTSSLSNLRFTGIDPGIVSSVRAYVERLGGTLHHYERPDGRGPGDYHIRGAGKNAPHPVKAFLLEHGLFGRKSAQKTIPDSVMRGGREAWVGFLTGMLDTDGTVTTQHVGRGQPVIEWNSMSRELLSRCQLLLAYLGVQAYLSAKQGRYKDAAHWSYRLTVTGRDQVRRLAGIVRPVGAKADRLADWRAVFAPADFGIPVDLYADEVESAHLAGEEPTISVEIEGTHTHVTDGIVTHNTELAAALALYFLIGDDEPAPLVVCAAASDEQADLVYGAAKTMVTMSPTLSQICTPFDKEILVPSKPGAKLQRVAAVAGTNDGKNIHAVICDELHEWMGDKGERVWNVLTNGTGARRQPMVLQITTAGYDLETVCGRQYQYGKRVQSGEVDDHRYYFHWSEASDGADHRDPAVWEAANPSYGTLVHEPFFQDQLSKKTESVFRRYFLNQWVAGADLWLPFGSWDACRSDLELDETLPTFVGIDIALRNDSTAVVVAQRQETDDGERTVVRARVWENPYPEGDPRHPDWKLNIFEVEEHLKELRARFPAPSATIDDELLPGPEFSYDPAYFHRSASVLEGEGLAMVEFPQHDSRMIPASQGLYQLVAEGKIAHDGDPTLRRHVENAIADQKPRGWRLTKPKGSRRKIDAAIALAIAVHRAQNAETAESRSVYEDESLLVI